MAPHIPQRILGLANDDVPEFEGQRLLVAGHSGATSCSGILMTSQQRNSPSIAEFQDDLSWFSFDSSPRVSFEQTGDHSLVSPLTNSAANTAANGEQEALPRSHSHRFLEVPMSGFPEAQMHKPPHYYAAALSEDDMKSLSYGEKNHNLKNWSAEDMVKFHNARRNLIPRVMPKVEKMNALADIEHDKLYCQRAVTKTADGVRHAFGLPHFKVTNHKKEHGEPTPFPRSSSSSPHDLPLSPMKSSSSPPFTHDRDLPQRSSLHTRAASSGDYSSHRPGYKTTTSHHRRISSLASSSGPSSDSSTRVRSPLAQEVQFKLNPDVTFDSFLVPDKSGKGETLPDIANAKKPKSRRLDKMPSMPLLRKRGQGD